LLLDTYKAAQLQVMMKENFGCPVCRVGIANPANFCPRQDAM